MSDASMTPRQMTVTLGPQTTVAPPRARSAQPVIAKANSATAPFKGPAVFTVPIVLPKTGRLQACTLTLAPSSRATLQIGPRKLATLSPGKSKKLQLDAKAFGAGKDFVIDELPFADFANYALKVTVAAPRSKPASLKLSANLNYLIPLESASDYLNYIMTQA